MSETIVRDGIRAMLPPERMEPAARKIRDYYARVPGAPFYQKEFGFYCLDRWKEQGMPQDVPHAELFGYDKPGIVGLSGLGWCEAPFVPLFEEEVLEDRGDHELARDTAGRHVLFFKGRRNGFMPEYVDHPVKDRATWRGECAWRLDPGSPERKAAIERTIPGVVEAARRGLFVSQHLIGGYMYLRSLMGPEAVLYMFYDQPDLVHECMTAWFDVADSVIASHQRHVTLDELYIAEDICYNHGPLISPDMMREFLLPYYGRLLENAKRRQIDRERHLYFQVDTDGFADPVIPVYRELGLDVMSPFEVAAGCDVVRAGKEFPYLAISGGVDKRVLAKDNAAIDEMVDSIFPVMRERGGFLPTCDHGVPEEVPYTNYLHYRKRCLEFAE